MMPVMSTDTPTRLRSLRPVPAGAEQLRAEVARLERRLQEQTGELTYWWDRQHPWGFDPFDFQRGGFGTGFGFPADRGQDRTHAPLPYLTESEYRFGIACNRDLLASNHLAIGFLDHVARFIGPVSVSFVLKGGAPGSSASGPVDADGDGEQDAPPEVVAATEVWEEWCEENDWGQGETDREYECLRRLIGEGETTLEWFLGARGRVPQVRHVEPELIRAPVGGYGGYDWACPEDWSLGVLTRPNDVETDLAIWVSDPDGTDGRVVETDRFTRARNNVDRCIKRGLSDFFPVAELLRKLSGLSDNMAHVARLQAAIAWWEQFPTATEQNVRAMIEAGRDYQAVRPAGFGPTAGANAGTANVRKYDAGSVVRTESGRQVMPGPTATPGGFVQVAELVMGGVSFRFGLPKSFSGDSDSFASALVTGSPFVRIIEGRQEKQKGFTRAVVQRALALSEESGRLPDGVARLVKPVLTCKPVVIADEEKQARTWLALYEQGLMDPYEIIEKRGGKPKIVLANLASFQKKLQQMGGPPAKQAPPQPPPPGGGGGGGGGQPPAGPNATPPGSAGGDGSSPNADPLTGVLEGGSLNEGRDPFPGRVECVLLLSESEYSLLSEEGRAGLVKKQITNKAGRKQTVWVRAADAAPKTAPAKKTAAGNTATPRKRKSRALNTVVAHIQRLGGIDPKSHALLGSYSHMHHAMEDGVPLAVFRKGGDRGGKGRGLDQIAQELERSGLIRVPENVDPSEYVISLIRQRAVTFAADLTDEHERAYQEYEAARHDAEQSHTPAEVADAVRRGEEAGRAEAEVDPVGEHGASAGTGHDPADLGAIDPADLKKSTAELYAAAKARWTDPNYDVFESRMSEAAPAHGTET